MASEGGGENLTGDFFFFVGIFLMFFLVWVATGGPSRPISFAGPFITPITAPGAGGQAYGNPSQFQNISGAIDIGGWGVGFAGGGSSTRPENPSALYGMVGFAYNTSGAQEEDEDEEYLTIQVSRSASEAISTAGWALVQKETGEGVRFPEGAELPYAGRVNVMTPVRLAPGDTAIVVSGRSPIGISFKENMCVGYFEERQNFHPSLRQECPTPYEEYDDYYDGSDAECEAYMRSIPYCSTDTDSDITVDNECEAFVEQYLTYNGCVALHEDEDDFYGTTWRIFLGANDELWGNKSETIMLLDAEGKTIDTLSY